MAILSIQSSVSAGHVGNRAAVLPLQRLGYDVWPVDTVVFSNHPAHGQHSGRQVESAEVSALLDGLRNLGLWDRCEGVLSGYLGRAETGPVVVDAVRQIRAARQDLLFLCDPVFGDNGMLYVCADVVDFYRNVGIAAADIVTPNVFEAAHLTGIDTATVEGAHAAAATLLRMGPRIAVVTGVPIRSGIATVAASADGAWHIETPVFAGPSHGAGDLFAALLLGHLLKGLLLADALSKAVSAVYGLLAFTPARPTIDLPLVEGQDLLLAPPEIFNPQRLA